MTEYYVARLGRSKIGQYIPAGIAVSCAAGYYLYHSFLMQPMKELFGYYDLNGQRDTISPNLRQLVGEVYLECRDKQKVTREFFESKLSQPASIAWFASSTLEPVTLGMTELRTGAMIGLPYYYNYETHDDVPDQALELRKIRFFRNPFKTKVPKKITDSDVELANLVDGSATKSDPKFEILKKFDRKSPEGREYLDTLVLSEDAKRFSVARELFLADSYRVAINYATIAGCGFIGIEAARWSVSLIKVSRMSTHLPFFALSACYAYGLCKLFVQSVNKSYYISSRDRAKSMGDNYARGAEEYFAKSKRRLELLATNQEDY